MKILLAGPGTGKTTKIKNLIDNFSEKGKILIMSFTNATVDDLLKELSPKGIMEKNCMTLHKFAVKYNHDSSRHVLLPEEEIILKKIAKKLELSFDSICDQLNATTFDQMIDRFVEFAKNNDLYLREKLVGFSYLIIDEYQDFNPHEQSLIDLLLGYFEETIILGDDDQCIYGFKDASSEKIIELHNNPEIEKIDHEHKCYRCPDKIVEHATNLIKKNKKRVEKPWHKSGKGGHLLYVQKQDLDDMANYVIKNIKRIQEHDPEASILILAPVSFIADPVAQKLSEEKIDFENANAPQIVHDLILKAWEIKSLFGGFKYLNLLFLGYCNLSIRKSFYDLLKKHLELGQNYGELFQEITKHLPLEVRSQYGSLEEMMNLNKYAEIKNLFNETDGNSDEEKLERIFQLKKDLLLKKIRVMSIHKSKGLGDDYVFVLGLTEGILPNRKSGTDSLELQRRVFYVAMTRAKKCLCIVAVLKIPGKFANKVNKQVFSYDFKNKLWNGKASKFISELNLK
jgi:DNA helicase-2/ATP-dependent DNA helicase PcrA